MWIILLEAGVALSLLLIIVWATWPKKDAAPGKQDDPPSPPKHHD